MENLIFLLSESWSTMAADQFFSMFINDSPGFPATNMFNLFLDMLRWIGSTVLVAILAWFVVRKMASAGRLGKKTSNLYVVESVNIGGQAAVQLIKAGEKYLVIGVTRERITLLGEVDKDEITEPELPNFSNLNTPFGKVLSRFVKPKDGPGGNIDDKNE